MIRASSLLYAIYVCLVIAILSGVLVWIFAINKQLGTRYAIQEQLLDRCDACFEYVLSQPQLLTSQRKQKVALFGDGLDCVFELKPWGVYAIVLGKSYFKNDTVRNRFLVGGRQEQNSLALYLSDLGEELKISGTTEIVGDVKLPRRGYRTVNLLGNQHYNNPTIVGNIQTSNSYLPRVTLNPLIRPRDRKILSLEELKDRKITYNSFDKPTIVVHLGRGEFLDRLHLKGNFIIEALDTLRIHSSSFFEDIIINAPKVKIEEDFKGSVQIYVTKEVEIASNVTLNYPSAIIINSTTEVFEKKITIAENSVIHGGIVMNGIHFEEWQNNTVEIAEETLIVGDVYCNGILELNGNVVGTVYAYKLKLETQSALYENTLLNTSINRKELPHEFIQLPLFVTTGRQQFGRIKKI